jgi:hypothetical protein
MVGYPYAGGSSLGALKRRPHAEADRLNVRLYGRILVIE